MPLAYFICPETNEKISFEDAPTYFDERGIMPAAAVRATLADLDDVRRKGTHLSASMLNPDTTCRREVVMKRFTGYGQTPWAMWDADEGTLYHQILSTWGEGDPLRFYEQRLPPIGRNETLIPGVPLTGRSDEIYIITPEPKDSLEVEIVDFKTTRFPWKKTKDGKPVDYMRPEDHVPQLNMLRYLFEDSDPYKRTVRALWVWRIYKGSYERTATFRKVPIPMVSREALLNIIGEFAGSLQGYLNACEAATTPEQLEAAIDAAPMDGHDNAMFNGTKCARFCVMQEPCFKLKGMVRF